MKMLVARSHIFGFLTLLVALGCCVLRVAKISPFLDSIQVTTTTSENAPPVFSEKTWHLNTTTTIDIPFNHINRNDTTLVVEADVGVSNGTTKRPKLQSLVHKTKIVGDPQFLLDFAILGAAKCGTTTMRDWLCGHVEAQCPYREVWSLSQGRPDVLVKKLYELPEGNYKRGYKSPRDFAFNDDSSQANVTMSLSQYWPKTKVFIGLRHPVRWFESFYNFRVHQRPLRSYMPSPNELIDTCHRQVCTKRALFHVALAKFGKTSMTAPDEVDMIRRYRDMFNQVPPPKLPNKMFVWITEQLTDKNETRATQFRRDVQHFVGFEREIPAVPHVRPPTGRVSKEAQRRIDKNLIDICDQQYDKVRAVLMDASRQSSVWIRKYFLQSEDVVVSSREHVEEILLSWMDDPCDSATKEAKS